MEKLASFDWNKVSGQMHENGFAMLPEILTEDQCQELIENYNRVDAYRKTVVMERYRFGLGEYKYFKYPLPDTIQQIRSAMYTHLVPIANLWFKSLNIDMQFPSMHEDFLARCHSHNQEKATVLILKYGKGGHNTLHQDLYGAIYFPIQIVLFLSEPQRDYTGGEFVLTKQVPRAQSKAVVLNPKKGDMLIFTTNFKPEKGAKSFYRVNMKHGVSEVHSGERYTLGIIFHDAES